jgi:fibronectin type 3 domain-containing protein
MSPTYARATPAVHGVNLAWTASVTPSVTYRVYSSTVSGGPYNLIATGITGTSYNDAGHGSGITIYYVLTSYGSGGESAQTSEVNATTL